MALMTKCSGIPLDVKALADDGTFEGYLSVFGNVDSYGEMVMPGAFTGSLVDGKRKGRSVKLLWQHDSDRPIGVWQDLAEDSKGLYAKGQLLVSDSAQAKEAYGLLKAGAVDGLSIGYRVVEAAPHPDKSGVLQLKKLDLMEGSIVTFPANERAKVDSVKHILAAGEVPTVRQFEELLRDAGFSKSLATAIAAKAAPHLRRDPGADAKRTDDFLNRLCTGLGIG